MADSEPTARDIAELNQRAANAGQSLKLPPADQPADLPQQILTVSSAFIGVASLPRAQTCDTAVRTSFDAVINIDAQEKKPDFNIGTLTTAVVSATKMRHAYCTSLPPTAPRLDPNAIIEMGVTIMVRGAAEIKSNPNGYDLGEALCDFGGQIASEVGRHPQVNQLKPEALPLIQMALGVCPKNMGQDQPEATPQKKKISPIF